MKITTVSKEEYMAAKKTVVYDCNVCGTEVTVNSEGVSNLSPIYCCGISLSKRTKKKPAKKSGARGKTASKTTAKKTAKKSPVQTAIKAAQKKRTKK